MSRQFLLRSHLCRQRLASTPFAVCCGLVGVFSEWISPFVHHTVAQEPHQSGRVIAIAQDFENSRLGTLPAFTFHNWSAEQKSAAPEFSQREIVADPVTAQKSFRLTVTPAFPWLGRRADVFASQRLVPLGVEHLPPTADAVRLRVRCLEGEFALAVGSPTIYYGNSDVLTAAMTVRGDSVKADSVRQDSVKTDSQKSGSAPVVTGKWQTLEFSLNHHLHRNFRRAGTSRHLPVIYYSRWIQEPLALSVLPESHGTLLIDDVQLVSYGEGRPFAPIDAKASATASTVIDFSQASAWDRVFSYHTHVVDFTGRPPSQRPNWQPPLLKTMAQTPTSPGYLDARMTISEEVTFVGVRLPTEVAAPAHSGHVNAVEIRLRMNHPRTRPPLSVDIVLHAVPAGTQAQFPWDRFQPPAEWQTPRGQAFDIYWNESTLAGVDYAFFHNRRELPAGETVTLQLPLRDFICAYGQGQAESWFREQQTVRAEQLLAIGFTPPFRHAGAESHLQIERVSLIHLPESADHATWYQQPDVSKLRLEPIPRGVRQISE